MTRRVAAIQYGSLPVTPSSLHEFFAASAGVAGALIGLLFVAVSVVHERLTADEASQSHRVRADAALTAFVNALSVSLFALIPGHTLGWTAFVVGVLGVFFVAASLMSLVRVRGTQPSAPRDSMFLLVMMAIFCLQLLNGLQLIGHAHDGSAAQWIAVLVIASFFVGIGRSWELIGGPTIGLASEVAATVRGRRRG